MTQPIILADSFIQGAIEDELTTVSSSATVCLSSSSVAFADSTTLTTAVAGETAYTGYARQLWGLTPIADGDSTATVAQGIVTFSAPSGGGDATITGFFVLYLDPASSLSLMGGGNFSPSDTMTVGGDGIALVLNLSDFDANA